MAWQALGDRRGRGMAEQKTLPQAVDLEGFLAGVDPSRRDEARRLATIFAEETGFDPVIWGGGMVGFGRYEYRYESGHTGSSMATGFAPRKAELVLYILPGYADVSDLLADLGKHRLGKSCLYLKRLEGVNEDTLRRLIRAGLDALGKRWVVHPA